MNDGSIAGGFEIGQGLWTKVKQMTAFALGQLCDDLDKVHVILIQADTLSMIHQGEGWYPTMEILDCPGGSGYADRSNHHPKERPHLKDLKQAHLKDLMQSPRSCILLGDVAP
ncbi:Os03g0798101 [Oryza sativa Japonica Group]|uniref:Os03g0798101 protein n=3 Tax=Oryza TaxID=4527 RepID=Q0DMQ7_ORYSJ|nr:hypothetical protein EE612_021024 [Oryza sativa]BAF13481.2 Os03g0798000 [Oryza sativa Japonica Group]BAS86861.1 Os03g0798101 [Oryza sativa Japonica Group]|eukprot:NP_001051567.2 Os03g0798000 [Oryza sativa Japonica Group]